ncbi:programmed cell death protein 5 [Moniliophthora roreri MCA 2997]|uniref:Programmed cell death protein 5 n=2 Tax=Moniliophthora roreri TaxID=221103 RepID=V2XNX9_MONRO|nr:programmed cell death protein 5 [Moniliophthora roreri MCA 2997]KAI3607889.1 programmed cell death protein 5 [Moniliophthora roreri]
MENISQLPPEVAQLQGSQKSQEDEAKKAQDQEQMRRDLMATVLDTAARERLSRIALVSPERSRQIEGILLRMAQTGQLKGRVSENQLIELLEQMEEAQGQTTTKKSTIVYQRRRDFDDDDDF